MAAGPLNGSGMTLLSALLVGVIVVFAILNAYTRGRISVLTGPEMTSLQQSLTLASEQLKRDAEELTKAADTMSRASAFDIGSSRLRWVTPTPDPTDAASQSQTEPK